MGKYRDRVSFVLIYAVEAHPVGSASPYYGKEYTKWSSYDKDGNPLGQPKIYQERREMAAKAVGEQGITLLVLVDEIDNPVWCTYGPAADITYLIGTDGTIVEVNKEHQQAKQTERAIRKYLGGL